MLKDDRLYIGHILEAARRVVRYTSGLSEAAFLTQEMVQDAVIRQLEIMGEAAKKVSKSVREKYRVLLR